METATMGRVLTEATIENLGDLYEAERGKRPADQVRRIDVTDVLVNTRNTSIALPTRFISQLGLNKRGEKRARSSVGTEMVSIYDAVRVTIQGREASSDVLEVPDDERASIGMTQLTMMDLVVDLGSQKLIGNPAHGGEQVLEL